VIVPAASRGLQRGVALIVACLYAAAAGAAGPAAPRNVLFIAIDDLNHWVGHLGRHPQARTPNIDRLAAGGVSFTRAYCTAPACNPSRASLMSGLRPSTTGCYDNTHDWHRGIPADRLLNSHLATAGYRVYGAGKIYHGAGDRGGHWDAYFPGKGGVLPRDPSAVDGGVGGIAFAPLACTDEEMPDHAVVDWCLERIREPGDRPFFVACGLVKPHMPFSVPKKWFDMFPLESIQLPPWKADDLDDVPSAGVRIAKPDGDHAAILASGRWKEAVQAYLATGAFCDHQVGRLLDGLAAAGRADDTLVVLWSDHGWSLGEKSHWRKFALWEEPTRTVYVWRVPGLTPSGAMCGRPVDFLTVYPTLCELTGSAPPAHLEGRSIVPLLRDPLAAWDEPALTTHGRGNHAVRTEAWRAIRYADGSLELYDEASDPLEHVNVAGDPRHAGLLEALTRRMPQTEAAELPRRGAAKGRKAGAGPKRTPVRSRRQGADAGSAAAAAARRPNIVFFLCDDLGGGDLSYLGSQDILTPHIDALFARGTRLSRHWAGCAVCAPSRCVLMTGRHPGHAVVRSNREVQPEGQAPMPEGTVTLARLLHDAGYATGGFGKWGLGAPGSVSDPVACGFDRFFGFNCQREAHSFYPAHLWRNRERVPLDNTSLAGSGPVARGGTVPADPPPGPDAFLRFAGRHYAADLIAAEQLAFVRAHAAEPFFLYVPTTVPHLALQVPQDEPSLADYERHFGDEEPYLGGKGYVPCRRPLATYAAMVTRMDREVGRIVSLLDELGLTDDTIFVFSSDNGATGPGTGGIDTARLASNGPLRDWKGSPYEGGLRVPTAIVWPGRIPAGRTVDVPCGFEDWLPTLLDLAGLGDRVPAGIDGQSLAPGLTGTGGFPTGRPLYRELTERQWQAAVDGHWKAVRRGKGTRARPSAEAAPTELYDLVADPAESRDVAAEHPDVVARMEAILDREHVPDPAWPLPFADARSAARPPAEPRGGDAPAARARPAAAPAEPTRPRRPNILFILADDQSPHDFRFYDPASTLRAPVIERLAAEGMVLDAAYHMGSFSGAVCTPSRHMIMCGRSVWHLPIGPDMPRRMKGQPAAPFVAPHCPPDIVDFTLPAVFNRAGYATMRTCKTGNSYEGANRLFTVRHDAEKRGGDAESGSAWHAERVLDELAERQRSGDDKPFLIYFGFSHPHDTRDGTPDLLARYGATNHADEATLPPADPRQPPLPPNWLPRHPFDNTHLAVRDEVSVSGVWQRRDERTIRNELGREFACAENIDAQIGRVLARLEAMGELDNTWIFYTADHGIAIGRHGLQGKQNLYEHTWRVPLIVKGPGVKPGTRAPGNVYLGDTLATLCDICGIEAPTTNEGTSFLPVLRGEKPVVRDVLYGVYSGGARPGMRAVRRGDWKLVKYESPEGGRHTQLFNLRDNPLEFLAEHHDAAVQAASGAAPTPAQRNLADDPAHAAVRAEMEALLGTEMARHDDPYRFGDQARVEPAPRVEPGPPAAARRAVVTPPEYAGTDVHHAVWLPADWDAARAAAGARWPVVVEYAGNVHPPSGSTGRVEDAALGHGLTAGRCIWVVLPFVSADGARNETSWWGDLAATAAYAKVNVPRICHDFGGDPGRVLLCGFSRGAIAVNHVGLHDDEIARLWCGFVTHDHYDGVREWRGTDWGAPLEAYRAAAADRLRRIGDRPVLVCQQGGTAEIEAWLESSGARPAQVTFLPVRIGALFPTLPCRLAPGVEIVSPHTDRWLAVDGPDRRTARAWVAGVLGLDP